MTVYSKYFNIVTKDLSCFSIIHPNTPKCTHFAADIFSRTIVGCMHFVLPFTIIPIATNIKRFNIDIVKDSVIQFLEHTLGCWLIARIGLASLCLFYHLFGKLYYPLCITMPGMLAASSCALVVSNKNFRLFSVGMCVLFVQVLINQGGIFFLRKLRDSTFALTIAFMIINASLVHLIREKKLSSMWFFLPHPKKSMENKPHTPSQFMNKLILSNQNVCSHSKSCDLYILEGIDTYLKYGFGVEIVRALFGNFSTIVNRPLSIFNVIYKNINLNFIAFFVGYNGLYRFLNCLINRKQNASTNDGHLLATFLSGSTFYLYPNQTVFAHGLITLIDSLWKCYMNSMELERKPKSKIIQYIDRLPIARILFIIFFGYLSHIRTFHPWLAPAMLKRLMKYTTNSRDEDFYHLYNQRLLGTSSDETLYLFGMKN